MVAQGQKGQQMGLKVYTGGTFDLIHSGHVNFLRRCAEIGTVTVALNTDEFIASYKGKPPVMSYDERLEILSEFLSVTNIVPNSNGADSRQTILDVAPDIIAIGSDWARKDYYKQMGFGQDWLDEHDISLMYIPYTKGISTTELKRRMAVN
jgi:glycerol-3-phosphate cytidylyltransferase